MTAYNYLIVSSLQSMEKKKEKKKKKKKKKKKDYALKKKKKFREICFSRLTTVRSDPMGFTPSCANWNRRKECSGVRRSADAG